jgi:DNA polymerase I-like protein with 3'-5' exonuclease and polymerase domains
MENAKGKYDGQSLEFVEKLLELRGITKNLGTYVNGFLDRAHGDTVHTTFNVTGPMTGRIANRGAGILTIPRDKTYRKMVVPSGPGRVLVKPDYGQLEMRLVSFFSRDPRFVAAFQPGMPDFFVTMLPDVFPDVDFSEMTPAQMKKSNYRTLVKPFSHGLNYGRGYRAIAKELKMDPMEAFRIASNYLGPEGEGLNAWQTEVKRKAVEGEDIVTPYGFHLQSELVTRQNRNAVENSALSFLPQSMGNDICLAAALRIAPQLVQYDAWIVATIHDQILTDCPIEHAKAVGDLMEFEMLQEGRNQFGDLLVMEAEPEFGFNWAEKMDPKQWDDWLTDNFVSQQSLDTRIKVSVG